MADKNGLYSQGEKSSKRRMTTDCNYSVFTTLLMRFLKQNNLYKISRDLARQNDVREQKNYSIIFLRIALYIFRRTRDNISKSQAVEQIFLWLQNEIDGCVCKKYKDNPQNFKKMVKSKNKQLLLKIRKVFQEGDLNNPENLKNYVIQIYEKKGKRYSKTHEKMASQLARLISGVTRQGDKFCFSTNMKAQVKIEEQQKEPVIIPDYMLNAYYAFSAPFLFANSFAFNKDWQPCYQ